MGGTIRSLTRAGYAHLDERVREVLAGAAATGGCIVARSGTTPGRSCRR